MICFIGLAIFVKSQREENSAAALEQAGGFVAGLPVYSANDVANHKSLQSGIWVTYKNGVYDVTQFVNQHPGGSKIMLAAGSSLEPYWSMYSSHQTKEVWSILEGMRIGNIPKSEQKDSTDKNSPYASDPVRSPILCPSSKAPYNAEPPMPLLTDNFVTPTDLFFVRNHLPVPNVSPKSFRLEIGIEGAKKPISLSLDDLKRKFSKNTIVSAIQCAGNRRSEMSRVKHVKGLNWNAAAVSNAEWSGVRLYDILTKAGIDLEKYKGCHVQFEGLDKGPEGAAYGASIPVDIILNMKYDVILAYEMNGKDLPRDHGYPLRVIAPGIVGARNVKWVNKVVISKEESHSHWQRNDYKGFNPSVDWNNVNFDKSAAIQQLPVNSAICEPSDGSTIEPDAEEAIIKGYALSGGGRGIVRVDVSADGGKTWHEAELNQCKDQTLYKMWAWTLWEAVVPLPPNHGGSAQIICKAIDSSYNVQPDGVEGIWNLRGCLVNPWHRIKIHIPSENSA